MRRVLQHAKEALVEEALDVWGGVREQRCTVGFAFAIACIALVIVGNVILLIGINFWLTVFPTDSLANNSSQIAIQVVASLLMVLFFTLVAVVYAAVFGGVPMWRALTDTNRMGHPVYRAFLLFASGASNGLSGVTGVYSMSHTPEFIQAVLLCSIPFSAQAWTVICIPEERQRNYLSLFFLASFLLFVGGILLSSMSAFLHQSEYAEKAPWDWALVYLLSSVLFGLWCVVQRLYLDAMIVRDDGEREGHLDDTETAGRRWKQKKTEEAREQDGHPQHGGAAVERGAHVELHGDHGTAGSAGSKGQAEVEVHPTTVTATATAAVQRPLDAADDVGTHADSAASGGERLCDHPDGSHRGQRTCGRASRQQSSRADLEDDLTAAEEESDGDMDDDDNASPHALLLAEKRSWAKQSVNDTAAKLVLLLGGLFFQLLVSFVVFPVDAIPWFGTSTTVSEAWHGFANSVSFAFGSWYNIRYGLLYTLGYIMSFIGCTFLNEHSPTLASVVLQLAGPITSLVILVVPQWNVYEDSGNVGHKVGGVVLLLIAALLYHVWEQRSLKEMVKRAHEHAEGEHEGEAERGTETGAEPIREEERA